MKKIIFFSMLLIISASPFSQQTKPSAALTQQAYLLKSKKQKTAAWILLSGGATLTLTGYIIGINSEASSFGSIITTGRPGKTFSAGAILFFTGAAAMLGSIPLFIASAKNKRKAMSATGFFKMETAPAIQLGAFVQSFYPALSVKINL